MTEPVDVSPDPPDIVQADDTPDYEREPLPLRPIPVCLDGDPVVRTREMPAVSGGWSRYDLALNAPAVMVLARDPRRKRAVLAAANTAGTPSSVGLGSTQAEAMSDRAFLLTVTANSNVTPHDLEVTHTGEVWAAAVTASVVLSVLNEQWAD